MDDARNFITGYRITDTQCTSMSEVHYIEPLAIRDIKRFIGDNVNVHPYWFEALK